MLYKFLNSGDVDKVVADGTLMVSSLSYFRKLESTVGDIGDRLEGASELTINTGMVATEGSDDLARLNAANIGLGMFQQFARVENGGKIIVHPEASFVHTLPELYIYSFAEGGLEKLTQEMCIKASFPYDACLQIISAEQLAHTVLREGKIRNLNNCLVSSLFGSIRIGAVEYVTRSLDISQGLALTPDPLRKAERFRPQSEVRLILAPSG